MRPLTLPSPASGRGDGKLSTFLRTVARGDALLRSVFRRGLLDHGPHDRLVGADPVGDRVPLRAVPLQELHRTPALVVHAGHLQGLHEAGGAELLELPVVDAQVLQAPADLVAGHRFAFSEFLLSGTNGLRGDDAEHYAAVVVDAADARVVLHFALA